MPILTIPDPASISKPRNDLSGNVHICGPFGEQAQGESHHCLATRTEKRKPSTRGISIKYVRLYHGLSCFYLCSYHLDVLHHGMLVCLPKGHLICKIVDRWMKPYFMQPHWRLYATPLKGKAQWALLAQSHLWFSPPKCQGRCRSPVENFSKRHPTKPRLSRPLAKL